MIWMILLEVRGVPDGLRQEMQGDGVDAPGHLERGSRVRCDS